MGKEDNNLNISKEHPFMKFNGKRVLIICQNDFRYHAERLEVFPDQKLVFFVDKYDNETAIAFEQIRNITEMSK